MLNVTEENFSIFNSSFFFFFFVLRVKMINQSLHPPLISIENARLKEIYTHSGCVFSNRISLFQCKFRFYLGAGLTKRIPKAWPAARRITGRNYRSCSGVGVAGPTSCVAVPTSWGAVPVVATRPRIWSRRAGTMAANTGDITALPARVTRSSRGRRVPRTTIPPTPPRTGTGDTPRGDLAPSRPSRCLGKCFPCFLFLFPFVFTWESLFNNRMLVNAREISLNYPIHKG